MSSNYDERPSATSEAHRSRRSHGHGHGHSHGHGHHSRRSREHSPEVQRPRHDDGNQEPARYAYPSSHPPSRPASPPIYAHARNSKKRMWPPSPIAEDERASLIKEVNPPRPTDSAENEAKSRGSLDQQPIILEVIDPTKIKAKATADPKAREKLPLRGGSAKAPNLDALPETPELHGRAPSPYAFTPKAPDSTKTVSSDFGYFSSPDLESQLIAEKRKAALGSKNITVSDALRGKGKYRGSSDEIQRPRQDANPATPLERGVEETTKSMQSRDTHLPTLRKQDLPLKGTKASLRDGSGSQPQPRLADLKSEALHGHRRNSESATTLPRPHLDESPRNRPSLKPFTPIVAASVAAAAVAGTTSRMGENQFTGYARSNKDSGSRPSSPTTPTQTVYPPATPSPRVSYTPYKSDSPESSRSSPHSSRPSSLSGSRPPSPKPYEPVIAGGPPRRVPNSATSSAVPDDRSQRTSGLMLSTALSDSDTQSSHGNEWVASPARYSNSLPYPVDDMNLMPSEEDHRYRPRALDEAPSSSIPAHTRSSASGVAKRSPIESDPPRERLRLDSRHTVTGGNLPSLATATEALVSKASHSPVSAKSPAAPSIKKPPQCPRSQSTRKHDDWYTLEGCADFDICPTCLEGNFPGKSLRKYFKYSPRKDPNQKTKCDFASPWMRLAWMLTQEQQRCDLDLIYKIARINAAESSCPGEHSETRIWHGLIDKRGFPVENFDVCSSDAKKLEALMPSLRGLFVRRNTGQKRKCDFRTESRRFTEYMDLLIDIDGFAASKRRQPDLQPFINLARQKSATRECVRDDMLVDFGWHFVPQLPEFTVCEECYSTVVWPAIAESSSVACRFNRTPQLVHEEKNHDRRREGRSDSIGTSCQLYSTRMRKVFKKAVQTGDFNYLARRARERKEVEIELQARFAKLKKIAADIDKAGIKGGWQQSSQGRGLQAEFEAVSAEWSKFE